MDRRNQSETQRIKNRARRNLNRHIEKEKKTYVLDTSVIINRFIPKLLEKGLNGHIIIPNAVIAELENLANKANEAGFIGLEQVANLHQLKKRYKITISFLDQRPDAKQIRYAKSGEIDALIREIAYNNKATLITSDLVQAKSAQAYGLSVIFLKPRYVPFVQKKKSLFSFFKRRKKNNSQKL